MSHDPKFGRYCDECGRVIQKVHRIYDGKEYCSSCYPRVFVKANCSECGKPARVHRLSTAEPVCSACERRGRVCIRCDKPIDVAGLISDGKPVCPSCAPYFRDKKCCAYCGKLSATLSTMPGEGIHELICESCRNAHTHKTCSVCRRYRKVAGMDADGRPFCSACRPGEEVSHACPACACAVPGAGNGKCRPCINFEAVERESRMAAASLSREWVANWEQRFAAWLHARDPGKTTLVKVYRSHHVFFERLDAQFVSQAEATADAILLHFGTAFLRKHLLCAQYLTEEHNVIFTAESKGDAAERGRIDDKLRECRKQPWSDTIIRYHAWLSDAKLPLRTMRLYLATAIAFCESAKVKDTVWPEDALQKFLVRQPGSRNNLSKFVGHCRRAYGWDVEMPRRVEVTPPDQDSAKIIIELSALMQQVTRSGMEKVDIKVLEKIIAKSLAFRIGDIARAANDQFVQQDGKCVFRNGDESVAIPAELEPYFREYAIRRQSQTSRS